ncbi:MAG: TRAP transporter substrate-binding protein [Desulfobacteraceae bacterium]|jgi:TRAP-type C4-dicarboxylate transport system substrate-binding protein|nr:TRAP transporter substrate-binding protein [Desulfobacteraceae bacterium]
MKKTMFLSFLIFCLSAVFTLSAFAKTELTYADFFPPTHKQSQLAASWCAEVEKRTNGEVVIKYFPAGSLAKGPQIYDGVISGIADIGLTVLSYTAGRFPVATAIDLPMGYKNGTQATRVANAVLNKFQPKEFDDTQIMYLHAHGPGLLHTVSKKVVTLDDMKGLKIRGTGTSGSIISALGGSPVGKPMNETYELLQKGVVDGALYPVESNKGWKLGEVTKYMMENYSTAYSLAFGVMMNKAKWKALSPETQNIINTINAEWVVKTGQGWDDIDKEGLDFFKEKGGEIVPQSPEESENWQKAIAPIFDEYIKSVSAKGIDGKAVVDFIKANL